MDVQISVKGQRINLGVENLRYPDNAYRKLSYGLAVLWLILFVFNSFKEQVGLFEKFAMSSLYLVSACYFLFKAHIQLSPTSKYAPHFMISESGLKLKTGVFKKSEFINWEDVQKIELGYYKIGIKDKTGLQYYPYQTRKETSIAIKRAIEAIAAQKGIEVENLLKK